MANGSMGKVMDHLRNAVLAGGEPDLTDGQLLECFVNRRDEAAVAALVRRHGAMVWGVCRRVLHNHHDAEDAFQATFLVLVRKATSILPREMVGNWLYGVAYQTARKARATKAKRQAREKHVKGMPEPEASVEANLWPELEPLLDQELSRLPEKYRAAIVLCDLQGKTRTEAARQLKIPEGTLSSRLTTARRMLAKRLARHGLTVSGGAVAAMLSQQVASAAVPPSVVSSTIKAATQFAAGQAVTTGAVSAQVAALTEGVVKSMLLTKIRLATAAMAVVLLIGVGAGLGMFMPASAGPTAPARQAQPTASTNDVEAEVVQAKTPPSEPARDDNQDVERLARELEQLMLAEQSKAASDMTQRLLAQDRRLAARVFAIVLKNQRIKGRSHIISAIHRSKLKEAVPALVSLLDDPDDGVRSWSITTLGDLGGKSALDPLEKRLRTEPQQRIRHNIRVALATLGRPYLKYFIDGLPDRDPDRRYRCLTALGELKDPRAVPFLVKMLDDGETRDVASSISSITGIPDTKWGKAVIKPDGGVSRQGTRRPLEDFKKDCEKWLAQHRRAVQQPLEKPAEGWHFTPEPLLPGLNVSFAMDAKQVIQVHKKAFLDYEYQPEKRWNKQGQTFHSPEAISATQSCLPSLNKGLVRIRYIFDGVKLSAIAVTHTSGGGSAIEPLKEPLQLRRQGPGRWTGLGGTIAVHPTFGDVETETYLIELNFNKE